MIVSVIQRDFSHSFVRAFSISITSDCSGFLIRALVLCGIVPCVAIRLSSVQELSKKILTCFSGSNNYNSQISNNQYLLINRKGET
jgi:hypothetical protein